MKTLATNKTETLILAVLSFEELHGLAIIDKVKDISDGKVKMSLGGLYTTLHRMEEKGLLESRWGETTEVRRGARRKYYKPSGLGVRALAEARQVFRAAADYGLTPTCAGAL